MATKDWNDVLKEKHNNYALKVTVSGNYTYLAKADIGTALATSKWQVKRVEVNGSNTIITWADGDDKFDNVATDLTALTYV